MSGLGQWAGTWARRLVEAGFFSPRVVFGILLLACVVGGIGASQLGVETATNSILERRSDAWQFYERSQKLFGEDEAINVAIRSRRPYSRQLFERVARLSEEFQALPLIRRVDSLSTVPLIRTDAGDRVSLEPIVSRQGQLRIEGEALRRELRGDGILEGTVISEDGRVAGMNLVAREKAAAGYPELVSSVREIVSDEDAWVSGVPVFRVATDRRSRGELAFFLPVSAAIMGAIVWCAFGSWRIVVAALIPGALGVSIVLGAMGFSGTSLNVTSVVLPPLLLALSVAYMMHIFVAAATEDAYEPVSAIAPVLLPIGLSCATTAIGFLAIGLAPVEAVQVTGAMGALGTLVVGAVCIGGSGALVRVFGGGKSEGAPCLWLRQMVPGLSRWIADHAGWILCVGTISLMGSAVGVFGLRVGTDVTRWFPEDDQVRRSWDLIGEHLSGLTPVNLVVTSIGGDDVTRPDVVSAIDSLARRLDQRSDVGHTLSFVDAARELGKELRGRETHGDGLPGTQAGMEQYLLVLESVEQMRDLVTNDRSAANVMIRANDNSSDSIRELAVYAEDWWAEKGPEGFEARLTGTMFEFARAEDEIAFGQLRGFAFAIVGVIVILVLVFRDFWTVLCATVANFAPIAAGFGALGWLGIRLDAGMVLVGSIALGIAVDDTIHVISAHQRFGGTMQGASEVYRRMLGHVLVPILLTTIAVSAAFGVLAVSDFALIANLGMLTSFVMVVCLVTDALFLPCLLRVPGWAFWRTGGSPHDERYELGDGRLD